MKKSILRYILYFQLIIQTFSTKVDVKYEITNKEATTDLPTKTKIVRMVAGARTNQITNFTIPNGQTVNSTKHNEIPILIKPVEENGLDAVFTEQTNLNTELTEIIILDTKNITVVLPQNEKTANESIKSMNVKENYFKYEDQNKSTNNVPINNIINLKPEHEYKRFGNNKMKSNHLQFFGSFIEPFGIIAQDQINGSQEQNSQNKTKFILQWTKNDNLPFIGVADAGQQAFINKNCSYTNCIVVKKNSSTRINYKKIDAVVFFARDLEPTRKERKSFIRLAKKRLSHQKYIFASLDYHSIKPRTRYTNFFNWTFTYKLNSDLTWAPFVVRDMNGSVVAPSSNVTWLNIEDMLPVPKNVYNVLYQKNIGVLWIYPCNLVPSKSICYIRRLLRVLKLRYGVHFDKISKCWYEIETTEDIKAQLTNVIKRDYYFYIVYDADEKEGYVSNEILEAVRNFAIPIVFGNADYSRYLPDKSYLDANQYTPNTLSREIYNLLRDFDLYVEYFKWTSHYSFHSQDESPETDHICRMCEMMNNETKLNETTVYENIAVWWDDNIKKESRNDNGKSVEVLPTDFNDQENTEKIEYTVRKRPMTPTDFIRKTAYVYTSFIDSILNGVKSVFTTIIG